MLFYILPYILNTSLLSYTTSGISLTKAPNPSLIARLYLALVSKVLITNSKISLAMRDLAIRDLAAYLSNVSITLPNYNTLLPLAHNAASIAKAIATSADDFRVR